MSGIFDNDDDDRSRRMEEAFPLERLPVAQPTGPGITVIDQQPRGAMRVDVPRDEGKIFQKIKAIATAAGDEFFYRWPTKNKDGSTGWVEGASVQCTNAVSRIYGNCLVTCRSEDHPAFYLFTARFYDMETGYGYERQFKQRKGQSLGGKMDAARAEDIVFQIGQSKALRNVVDNALGEFTAYALREAKSGIVKLVGADPEKYRARLRQRIEDLKVELIRVEHHVGRPIGDWLAPDMAMVIAEIQTINDNMATADELWPRATIVVGPTEPTRDQFADNGKADGTKPADKVDDVARQVDQAIADAAAADAARLEDLDDQVSALTDSAGREDQRARWNPVYTARKAALASPLPAGADNPPVEPTGAELKAQQFRDWLADQRGDVDKAKTSTAIDLIEEEVRKAFDDPKDPVLVAFIDHCNAAARALSRKKK